LRGNTHRRRVSANPSNLSDPPVAKSSHSYVYTSTGGFDGLRGLSAEILDEIAAVLIVEAERIEREYEPAHDEEAAP
jgi:hypothetical protein